MMFGFMPWFVRQTASGNGNQIGTFPTFWFQVQLLQDLSSFGGNPQSYVAAASIGELSGNCAVKLNIVSSAYAFLSAALPIKKLNEFVLFVEFQTVIAERRS